MHLLTRRLTPLLLFGAAAFSAELPSAPAAPELFQAIRDGDFARVRNALRAGVPVNGPDANGTTPLMHAALHGNGALIKLLLDRGADPNAANHAGATALMWAVSDYGSAKLLLERGANPNARSKEGRTPLLIAARIQGSADTIRMLLSKGADPAAVDELGGTALMLASDAGDLDVVQLLLDRGAAVDAQASPLFGIPRFGNLKLEGPLPKGVGMTALIAASISGHIDIARLLLDKGADPNRATLRGFTPLMYASMQRETALAGMLLANGANVNARERRKATALILAASSDDASADMIRLLLDNGADSAATDAEGRSALDWASRRGRTEIVSVLRGPSGADRIAAAVNRSLPLLQRSGTEFAKRTGCISCHHNSILQLTTAAARRRGYAVNEEAARQATRFTAAVGAPHREPMLQGVPTVPASTMVSSYALIGLAAEGYPADAATDALTIELANRQRTDGSWQTDPERPPLGQGAITATALSLRTLQLYGPPARKREFEDRVRRAASWLASAPVNTAQERAMRVLGLAWAGSDTAGAAAALMAAQRPDGGWSQMPALESDAYATGLAMYALFQAGAVKTGDPAWRRGVEYLLDTQQADGSWHVRSRALGFQPYFESGYPHGPDQWISAAAGAWATLVLCL